MCLLTAFQEQRWPRRIDDPLPGRALGDREGHLRDTVQNLNRNVRDVLRFQVEDRGTAVLWRTRAVGLKGPGAPG